MGAIGHLAGIWRSAPKKKWVLQSAVKPYRRSGERTVISADGTPLSVRRSGEGEPVVLVHGTTAGKDNAFVLVESALAEDFAVWSYDRRGRGRSGDAPDHSWDTEVDDLQAVIAATGAAPHVIGHSFGAVCALAAAQRDTDVASLVLYEPPFRQQHRDEAAVHRIADAVARDDLDVALQTFYLDLAGMPEDDVALIRSIPPLWNQLKDGARTIPRELEVLGGCDWRPEQWSLPHVPMLLVTGSETRARVFPTIEELRAGFPHAEADVITGQQHQATALAPWRFTESVRDFLRRHGPR